MTTWILIWVIHGVPGVTPGITSGSALFHSQQACLAAIAQFKKRGLDQIFCNPDPRDIVDQKDLQLNNKLDK